MSLQDLIEGWKAVAAKGKPPYLFRGDEDLLLNQRWACCYDSMEEYIRSETYGSRRDSRLHLGLLPVPWLGDIKSASVFILSMNPGFEPSDYLVEAYPDLQDARRRNLTQEWRDMEFPFMSLSPGLAWTRGAEYWRSRLGGLAEKVAQAKSWDRRQSLSFLAKSVGVLQLVPYRSRAKPGLPDRMLQSSKLIVRFAQEEAADGEALIVVARGARTWGLDERPWVISKSPGTDKPPVTRSQVFTKETLEAVTSWLLNRVS